MPGILPSRDVLSSLLIAPAAYLTTKVGSSIDLSVWRSLRVVAIFGTHVAIGASTVKLQGSADGSTGWTDIASSEKAISDSTLFVYNLSTERLGYRFVRPVFTRASGATIVGGVVADRIDPSEDPDSSVFDGTVTFAETFNLE
jgi:hypothetical protein